MQRLPRQLAVGIELPATTRGPRQLTRERQGLETAEVLLEQLAEG